MTVLGPSVDLLAPVRDTLLAEARADAQRLLAQADAEAASTVAGAAAEADRIRGEARAQGEADAASVLAAERARARRQARAVVLGAQRDVYEDLRASVLRRLPALRDEAAYGGWRDRLRARVHAELGADAVVTEDQDGGVVGQLGGRRVAYTLAGLADRALDELGEDVEGLWSP